MKTVFVTKESNEEYVPGKHRCRAWKFLYWHDENPEKALLLIGDGQYGLENASHQNLPIWAEKNGCDVPDRLVDGAGNFWDGLVDDWSTGFKGVRTPEKMRPLIFAAFVTTEK